MLLVGSTFTHRLLERRETGMGYQIVKTNIRKTPFELGIEFLLVLNAEVIDELFPPFRSVMKVDSFIQKRNAEIALSELSRGGSFEVLSEAGAQELGFIAKADRSSEKPASENPPEKSKQDEEFLRFSAFSNDRRINADGSVLPDTYVTTRVDGLTVRTGAEAVARYALPNPTPAEHRYHLKPPTSITVRRGRVAPAYGQPGGGIEVVFVDAGPKGTKYKQDRIPPT